MSDDVRRHCDGSIDFGFYREKATALRRQAFRETFRPAAAGAVMAGGLGFAIVIPPALDYASVDRVAAILASHLR